MENDKSLFFYVSDKCLISIEQIMAVKKHSDGKGFDIFYKLPGEHELATREVRPVAKNATGPTKVYCNSIWRRMINLLEAHYDDMCRIGKHTAVRTDCILSVTLRQENAVCVEYKDGTMFMFKFNSKAAAAGIFKKVCDAVLASSKGDYSVNKG